MRLAALFLLGALLLAAAPLAAPTASACQPVTSCVDPPCVFSFHNDPECIVRNPCDPRSCDPRWP